MRVPMTPRARAIVAAEGSPSRADRLMPHRPI